MSKETSSNLENDFQILTDADIRRLLDTDTVIEVIEETFRQMARGNLTYPPRIYVEGEKGALAFTVGDSPNQNQGFGFRVYSMFKNSSGKNKQLVAVFDSDTGAFKGAVIGNLVGKMRTGAIGGVAVKYLSRSNASVLGMIGTGIQAVTQLQAAAAVRNFNKVLVYSRNSEKRGNFAIQMSAELGLDITAVDSAQAVVETADVLICATTSSSPIFDPSWIKPGVHITTIGPKIVQNHELPVEAAIQSDIVTTDTLAQIEDFGERYFLHDHIPLTQYVPLSDIVAGNHPGRTNDEEITLFCSTGLAGTEVAVASHALALNQS